jgi:ribosome maturation factor RimP
VSVEERVDDLLSPIVATLDVDLLDVEFAGGILRLTIDRDGGVTTDQLAQVNRLVGPLLDQHDPVPGRYTLEVSSPGLERSLKRPAHYLRAVGVVVVVKMEPGVEPRRYKGELTAATDDTATLTVTEIDGVDLDEPRPEELPLADVSSARTVFDWGPQPKPGGGGAKRSKKKQSGDKKKNAGKSARPRGVR